MVATEASATPSTVTGEDNAAPPDRVARPVTVAAALIATAALAVIVAVVLKVVGEFTVRG